MTTACRVCGTSNRENAKFCVNCAARLGVEPIGQPIAGIEATGPRTHRDSGFDASRTAYSHPMGLRAALMSREPAAFWVRAGIIGLVLLIGFVGWCVYVLTANKLPPPSTAVQNAVLAAPRPPAEPKPANAQPDVDKLAPEPTRPTTTSEPRTAAVAVPGSRAANAEPRSRVVAATPPRNTEPRRARAVAAPRAEARERVRVAIPSDEDGVSPNPDWVEPSRPNAQTSMPTYQDSGPPIVQGPGPRYDFSSPGATPR